MSVAVGFLGFGEAGYAPTSYQSMFRAITEAGGR
jgi:hypothetical protein